MTEMNGIRETRHGRGGWRHLRPALLLGASPFPQRSRRGRLLLFGALAALALATAAGLAANRAHADRLYVTNLSNNTIFLFRLGAEGKLLENGTRAFPNEFQSPDPVVIGRDGKSLYVGTEAAPGFGGSVSQFTVALDGTLTLKEPPWASTEFKGRPEGLAISPDGISLYAPQAGAFGASGSVTQFNVGSGGLLSLKEPHAVAAGAGPNNGVAIAPNGASVYVSNISENTISQYSVGAGGTLTPMTPATVPSGTEPWGIAITPDGSSLYVADFHQEAISQYSVGPGGALTPKTPATVPAGREPTQVATSADGKNVYASDRIEAGQIFQYTVGSGGALIPKSPSSVPAERQPTGLAISPDGKNLYVAETASNTVSQYRIEANGNLNLLATARTGVAPKGIAFSVASEPGPTVTKVEPNHGSPGGGTTVTITGTGFTGATAVDFGTTSAKSFTVNSATSITAVSPKVKGTGTVDVTVTTPNGTSPTSAADQFTFSRK